ncbi:hypothetical protein [Oceanicola granulosus]|uniref:hypothetical protein n=1 Tax=Oceanicola granulosus TaxID=252302 RepID=UPI0012E9B22F|nr:hypothetical protein [Oceanicola granulosus]
MRVRLSKQEEQDSRGRLAFLKKLHLRTGFGGEELEKMLNEQCCTEFLCGRRACPRCAKLSSQRMAIEIEGLVDEGELGPSLTFVTLVHERGTLSPEDIVHSNIKKFASQEGRKICGALRRGAAVIGAVDDGFIKDVDGSEYFQRHSHCIVSGKLSRGQLKNLKQQYPKTESIQRPVHTNRITPNSILPLCKYMLKIEHYGKSKFIARPKSSGRNPYKSSATMRLPQYAEEALIRNHAQFRVTDSLILVGLRRKRSADPTACNSTILKR